MIMLMDCEKCVYVPVCTEVNGSFDCLKALKLVEEKFTTTNSVSPKFSPCGECGSLASVEILVSNGDNYCRRCGRKLRA